MSQSNQDTVTQKSSLADATVVPSALDLCIARGCLVILTLRNFQFNALSRLNQRLNLPYKKALRDIFGGIQSTSVATTNSATLLLESSLLNIINNNLHFTTIHSEPAVKSDLQLIYKKDIYTSS